MKRWLLVLLLFLAVVGAAGAALRLLVDWDGIQQELLAGAGRSVGLQIDFDGAVDFTLLPRPALNIDGVRIAPTSQQGDQTILAAEQVVIRPSLAALLVGRIEIQAITLAGVSLALERDASGTGNWEGLMEALEQGGDEAGSPAATRIVIARGTVFFHDRASGRQETIGNIAGQVTLPGEIGSYEVDLAFLWRGVALSLTGRATQPSADGAASFDLALRDAELGSLNLSGQANPSARRIEQGRIQIEGRDAGKLLARFGNSGAWPASLRNVQATGRFAADIGSATFDDLRLKLGDTSASGGVVVRFGAQPSVDIAVNAPVLDLDPLLAGLSAGKQVDNAPGATWPTNIAGRLSLGIGAVNYRGSAVRDLKLDGALTQGIVAIEHLEGVAPGGTAFKLTGRVESASAPRLRGQLEARSDDLRTFLTWLGADLSGVAATRLRRAQMSAAVTLDERVLQMSGVRAEADSSTVTGRVEIPWDGKADIGVALEVDRLDIDAYRPPSGPAPAAPPTAALRGVKGSIAISRATFDGRLLQNVKAEGRWTGAGAELQSFSVEVPGAASLQGNGKVEAIGRAPRFTGRVSLESRQAGELIRWLGFQPSPGFEALQEFAVSAELAASEQAVSASGIEASLGDLRVTGSAGIELAGGRPKVTAELKIPSWRVPWEAGKGPAFDAPRPVDFRWLSGFDADLRLAADELHALRYTLSDARAAMTIREHAIELRWLSGRAYDGWLRARGRLDAAEDRVTYAASVEGGDLAIEPLLIDAAEFGEVAGKLHLAVEVKGAGSTDIELIRSADGTARIVATEGTMRGFDMGRIAKRLAGLENITDIPKLIDAVEQGGQTRFNLVQGELSIASGVARSDNVQLQIEGGTGKANGWVDLAASTVSLRGEVTVDEAPGKPTIGIVVRGPLEAPEREIKTGELSRYIQQRINAAAMGKAPPPEAEIQAAVPHTIELPKPPRRFRKPPTQ
ncbi:AsmA family protein [Desertibaculum subflavum]|uniref:AsmA family protein n=1 Tax=Desertibaculum subflavum TaxID=2268458 RepID=UPI0013C46E49